MVKVCCVCGLVRKSKVTKQIFYNFPRVTVKHNAVEIALVEERLAAWREAVPINFGRQQPTVCSDHFKEGKPAYLYFKNDVDWIPSINMISYDNGRPAAAVDEENDIDWAPTLQIMSDSIPFPANESTTSLNEVEILEGGAPNSDSSSTISSPADDDISTFDFISPDLPLRTDFPSPSCFNQHCFNEKNQLRCQLQEKTIALDFCQVQLEEVRRELADANEQLATLRAQLEENTQAMCTYLNANGDGGNSIIVKTEKH